jgi:lysophospholipase L1-like esterase
VAKALTGKDAGGVGDHDTLIDDVVEWYSSRSMAVRGVRGLQGALGLDDDTPPAPTGDSPPEAVGERAADVYVRAREVVAATAERRGIPVAFYWQPVRDQRGDVAYRTATGNIGDGSIDISDALDDHQDVYWDEVHTNEVGAALVAERMWQTLESRVRDVG